MLNIQNKEELLSKIEEGILQRGLDEFHKKRLGKQNDSSDTIPDLIMLKCIREEIDSDENKELLLSYLQNKYKVTQKIPFVIRNANYWES